MYKYLVGIIFIFFIFSCKNVDNQSDINSSEHHNIDTNNVSDSQIISKIIDTINLVAQNDDSPQLSYHNTINICPIFQKFGLLSPSEFFTDATEIEADFSLLYPINVKNSTQSFYNNSILIGVYIADLMYSISYQNKNSILDYYSALLNYSADLQAHNFFYQSEFNYFEITNNLDTISLLINTSVQNLFFELDKNENYKELPFVLYGSWLESVYLISKTVLNSNNAKNETYIKIYNQLQIADNMITYFKKILVDTKDYDVNLNIQNIISELEYFNNKISNLFPSILNSASNFTISQDNLLTIVEVLLEIRNNLDQTVDYKMQIQMSKSVH